MSLFFELFASPPCPSDKKSEVKKLMKDLTRIGQTEGFLSERPGGGFNVQCRNIQAREIGKKLHDIGGVELMDFVMRKLRRPLGKEQFAHLEYCWAEIGSWLK